MKYIVFTMIALATMSCANRTSVRPVPVPTTTNSSGLVIKPLHEKALIPMMEAENIYSLALTYMHNGYYSKAVDKLKYLISKRVQDKYLYETLLSLYVKRIQNESVNGTPSRRVKRLIKEGKFYGKDAIARYPKYKPILYQYTELARFDSDFVAFLGSLAKILRIDNTDVYANYYLGAYHFLNKSYAKAKPYLSDVIVYANMSKKTDAISKYNALKYLGIAETDKNNYSDAISYLEKAKSIYSEDIELLKLLGMLYTGILDFENSAEIFAMVSPLYYDLSIIENYAEALFMLDDKTKLKELSDTHYADSLLLQSIIYFQKSLYTNSIKTIQSFALQHNTANYVHHYLLFLNYKALGNNKKMTKEAFILGKTAKDFKRHKTAIEFLSIVEQNTNTAPDIYWLIGSLYDESEKYNQAVKYYKKYLAYESAPDRLDYKISALVRLSYMYYKLDKIKLYETKILEAKQLAEYKSDRFQAYYYAGIINAERKKFDKASDDFEQALKIDPSNAYVYYFLASTLASQHSNNIAIGYLEKAIAIEKNAPEINNLLAYLYAIKNINLDEALRLINLALIKDPGNIAFQDTLGWIYYKKGDFTKAINVFNTIELKLHKIKDMHAYDEVYYHIGMIYEKLNNTEKAIDYYKKGKKANPDNTEISERLKSLGSK